MKKHNPSIPIMLREAQGTSPKVYARYEFGQEKSQSLEGKGAPPPLLAPREADRPRSHNFRPGRQCACGACGNERWADGRAAGLSDKQIEDAVTTLVRNES